MHWEKKNWGQVWHLYESAVVAVDLLWTRKGGFSSKHFHSQKDNLFLPITSEIIVEMEAGDCYRENWTKVYLRPGKTLMVPALVTHLFRVEKTGLLLEVYLRNPKLGNAVIAEDITRLLT